MSSPVPRLRIVVGASVALALGLTILLPWAPRLRSGEFLVVPAALAGAVSPVIGFRLIHWLRQRAEREERAARRRAYATAVVAAVAVTETAAIFGLVVAAITDELLPLLGLVTHVVLVGAIWPTSERMELFVEGEHS